MRSLQSTKPVSIIIVDRIPCWCFSSGAAQGGGGSFKHRKNPQEVLGCWFAWAAEQAADGSTSGWSFILWKSLECMPAAGHMDWTHMLLCMQRSPDADLLAADSMLCYCSLCSVELLDPTSICLSVFLSVCLSVYRSIYWSIYLSIYPSIYLYLSIYLSLSISISKSLSISKSISISTNLSLSIYIYLSLTIDPSSELSMYLSICLSIYLLTSLAI